jgi:hypothetical protein
MSDFSPLTQGIENNKSILLKTLARLPKIAVILRESQLIQVESKLYFTGG